MTNSSVVKNTAKKVATRMVLKKMNLATIKIQLIILAVILGLLLMTVIITGLVSIISGGEEDSPSVIGAGQAVVSAEVAQYRNAVFTELSVHGLSEYTELVLALMMQESGGKGNDPMQASESYCGEIGCITDPQLSIEKGVLHFKNVLESANKDVNLTLQSYNFGGGFIDYVLKNGGAYTKELTISFSQMMYEKLKQTGIYKCHRPEAIEHNACYGDIAYVDAVLKYLPSAVESSGVLAGGINSPLSIGLLKTSSFGWRLHPIEKVPKLHAGIDLNCNLSDSIHAAKDGTVVKSEFHGSLGNYIKIHHSPTDFTTYGHMSRLDVGVGKSVVSGQQIGMCGSTGGSTNPHLHFEIHTQLWGGYIDPASHLGL